MGESMFAKVIIDIKHEEVNQTYDYIVPDSFQGFLERGMRVMVPFGPQIRMGYIIKLIENSQEATKEILEVLDITPVINEETFMMIDTIMDYAPNLYSAIFSTVLPIGLQMRYQKEAIIIDSQKVPDDLQSFFSKKGIWRLSKNDQVYYPRLKRLYDQKIIDIKHVIKQKGGTLSEILYQYNSNHQYSKMMHYSTILDAYTQKDHYSKKELIALGMTASNLKTLEKHQVLIPESIDVYRKLTHHFELKDKKVELNGEQKIAYQSIKSKLDQQETFLLKGVTGSGKTEIYLNLIEDMMSQNQVVMILVPEITLIAPLAQRLKSRFDDVAIYHSALSQGEKYDQYQLIFQKRAQIILGTRSAIFLPVDNLGLIIMDEEQDSSYIQDESVFYDTKLIAKLRSQYHNIPLILGSATPSIVSMHQALNHEIHLLELKQRHNNLKMPKITLVDMKEELKQKNSSIFSNALMDAMKKRLAKKEQIILLFNRKGYAPFVMCKQCGDVPMCPHCDISLTYYKDKNTLKCHYCGFEKPYNSICEVCKEPAVKEVGIGIEYVENQLHKALPEARVLRMDANTTRNKGKHEELWNLFNNYKADILLGTQMVAKGLDFPKVTLVGVLMADLSLKVPSFQASEQAYMLFAQVTGRSGRFLPGEAIIQGYNLEHYAIKSILDSYDLFYNEAIYYRKLGNYKPFKNTAQILIEGEKYLKTYQQAFLLRKALVNLNYDVLGPTPAIIKRIKDQFRFTLTIKSKDQIDHSVFDLVEQYKTKEIFIKYYPNLDKV